MANGLQSEVGIASAALVHMGRDPIATFEAAGATNANILKERYPAMRDLLLRTYPWNFAMSVASLPGKALEPAQFGFTHACELPAGGDWGYCLRLWKVEGTKDYQVRGRALYVKRQPPVAIRYIRRETNPELFDPIFAELLSIELAIACLNRIPTADVRKSRRELEQERKRLRREARLADAMEASPQEMGQRGGSSWLNARRPL